MRMYTIEECSLYKDSIIISGIPVYIFDDHNMALPAWGVSCSRLRQPLNLVTFDKHADTHPSFHSYVFDQTGEAADSTHLGLNNPEINVILKSMHYQPNDFCFEDVFKIAADYLENDEHILAGMDSGYLSSYTVVTREGDEALGYEHDDRMLGYMIMWRLYDSKGNTIDHSIFRIPFILAVDKVYGKVRNLTYRYLPNQMTLFPTETQQYDPWLLRELLNNCIAHQDYTAGRRIYVDEFEDLIQLSNAGNFLPGDIKPVLEPAYAPPYYRNPLLAQAMVNFKMIDTAAMGIRRVFSIQREKLFPMPGYNLSKMDQVEVTVHGRVLNENYTKVLFENPEIDLETVYLLDKVQKGERISREEANALRKLGLVEGKLPNLIISATIAESLDQKAQYIKNKGFDDAYYKQLIIDYLKKWEKGKKADFDKLLLDKLPDSMTEKQKKDKIRNLLAALRAAKVIKTDSPNRQTSNWILNK